ncbi:hypothetical protein LCGC14_2183260 [marine sediment metagenome]|uniref:Uncharacterized protein n=1 Tax=marine sediment metagenome TaxID=412755 RepID=A0A0F9GHF3_9ZZZZ
MCKLFSKRRAWYKQTPLRPPVLGMKNTEITETNECVPFKLERRVQEIRIWCQEPEHNNPNKILIAVIPKNSHFYSEIHQQVKSKSTVPLVFSCKRQDIQLREIGIDEVLFIYPLSWKIKDAGT